MVLRFRLRRGRGSIHPIQRTPSPFRRGGGAWGGGRGQGKRGRGGDRENKTGPRQKEALRAGHGLSPSCLAWPLAVLSRHRFPAGELVTRPYHRPAPASPGILERKMANRVHQSTNTAKIVNVYAAFVVVNHPFCRFVGSTDHAFSPWLTILPLYLRPFLAIW